MRVKLAEQKRKMQFEKCCQSVGNQAPPCWLLADGHQQFHSLFMRTRINKIQAKSGKARVSGLTLASTAQVVQLIRENYLYNATPLRLLFTLLYTQFWP